MYKALTAQNFLKVVPKSHHLFNQLKVKYHYIIKNYILFVCIWKINLFLWWQSWIFSIITPVFSVTRSLRNYSNNAD